MISTWQQHSDNSSNAQLAGLPALATAAAAAEGELEGPRAEAEKRPGPDTVEAQRVDSNAQSDPIEPQPTPFEAFTQAPLSGKPEPAPPQAKAQPPEISASMESSAMNMSLPSASRPPSDGVHTASIPTGGTGSVVSLLSPSLILNCKILASLASYTCKSEGAWPSAGKGELALQGLQGERLV